ncbi:MAG: hypothetical protein QXI12_13130 [Candidatus Methanomethyliaceae archaeon]
MTQGIFLIQSDGSLVELAEAPYDSEALLQELLARYPNLLSGSRPMVNRPRRWLLIKREMGIQDKDNAGDRWSLDHLFLDQDGIPTLVEVKRSTDTRIRREVIGQMLDYAANAIVYWPVERIQAELESTATSQGLDADIWIQEFLGEDHDILEFWQNVKANLASGRIRLIFVADEIPRELQRVVEFLNQQMNPAEVYAVEVKQYVGQGIRSLVPRIVGITADAEIRKSVGTTGGKQWDEDSFFAVLKDRPNHRELEVAEQILNWAKNKNLRIAWGSGSIDGAFYPMMDCEDMTHYTFCVRTGYKNAHIQIQFAQFLRPFDTAERRRELANRIEKATDIRIADEKLQKYPKIELARLDERKLQDFLAVFDWYIEQCQSPKMLSNPGSA